jgi:hypothetical protein
MFSSAKILASGIGLARGRVDLAKQPAQGKKGESCASDSTPAMTDTFTMQSSTVYYAKQHHWNCIPAQRWT